MSEGKMSVSVSGYVVIGWQHTWPAGSLNTDTQVCRPACLVIIIVAVVSYIVNDDNTCTAAGSSKRKCL